MPDIFGKPTLNDRKFEPGQEVMLVGDHPSLKWGHRGTVDMQRGDRVLVAWNDAKPSIVKSYQIDPR